MRALKTILIFPMVWAGLGCGADSTDDHLHEDIAPHWEALYENMDFEKGDNATCSGVVVPDSGPFDKRVALTFDDGPNLTSTPQVLEVLKAHDIKATFFINGKRVTSDAHRQLLVEMRDAGHLLANHSQSHKNLKNVSADTLKTEIEGTHAILQDLIETPTYFRFPFGSSNCTTAQTVRDYGYRVSGWHIDSGDWCFANSQGGVGFCSELTFRWVPDSFRHDMAGYVLDQTRRHQGGIVLFHDVHQNTADSLEEIITRLKDEDFEFTNMDDTTAFPQLNGLPPIVKPFVGTPCEIDADCAFSVTGREPVCHRFGDELGANGICTVSCDGYCPDMDGHAPTFCVADGVGAGMCTVTSAEPNSYCSDIPGTIEVALDRYIGDSTATITNKSVCAPPSFSEVL